MKKIMTIILLILPIFLMIAINLAGRIVSNLVYIPVESIDLIDDQNESIKSIKLSKDESLNLNILVYPEFSTNKEVSISSNNTDLLIVDNNSLTAIEYGQATLTIRSLDNHNIVIRLLVTIADYNVLSVSFERDMVEINIKDVTLPYQIINPLKYSIYPHTALDKSVTFTSSDPSIVSVNSRGILTINAFDSKDIIITVTTNDGNFNDQLIINLIDSTPILSYNYNLTDEFDNPINYQSPILLKNTTDETDLLQYIQYDDEIIESIDQISFKIIEGSNDALITNNTSLLLTNQSYFGIIVVEVSYEDITLLLRYRIES